MLKKLLGYVINLMEIEVDPQISKPYKKCFDWKNLNFNVFEPQVQG